MIKKIFAGLLFLWCAFANAAACGRAVPIDNPGFCADFKLKAACYCTSAGLPSAFCQNMRTLYSRMLSVYGTLEKACSNQSHTSQSDCLANWNCYRLGVGQQHTDDNRLANCLHVCERF
jgi:hypothetical protein